MPEYVTHETPDGQKTTIPVAQIWIDPKFPDAHRDPALRAWLERRRGFCGLVRYGNDSGLVLIPPYMNDRHEWIEHRTDHREESHSFGQVLEALSGVA